MLKYRLIYIENGLGNQGGVCLNKHIFCSASLMLINRYRNPVLKKYPQWIVKFRSIHVKEWKDVTQYQYHE